MPAPPRPMVKVACPCGLHTLVRPDSMTACACGRFWLDVGEGYQRVLPRRHPDPDPIADAALRWLLRPRPAE